MTSMEGRPSIVRATIALVAVLLATPSPGVAECPSMLGATAATLDAIVRDLKIRLEISVPVAVSIVPENSLMMSVTPPVEQGSSYQLEVDAAFLATLTGEEVEAAIAHELGHVWVFTLHPYLQTEALANQIAMRAVTRACLEEVYGRCGPTAASKAIWSGCLGPPGGRLPLTELAGSLRAGSVQCRLRDGGPSLSELKIYAAACTRPASA